MNKIILPVEYKIILPVEYKIILPVEYKIILPVEYKIILPIEFKIILPVKNIIISPCLSFKVIYDLIILTLLYFSFYLIPHLPNTNLFTIPTFLVHI